jgi:uncharacterized protein
MLMVPFLTLDLSQRGVEPGMAVKMAIATSMATILFTSLSSVRAHHRGAPCAGTWCARWRRASCRRPAGRRRRLRVLKGQGWRCSSPLFIGFSALQMLLDRKPKPGRQMPGPGRADGRGGGIGFCLGPGRRRRRLHVGALHDLVQRADPPGGGHQRGAGLPDRLANTAGLRDRRLDLPPRCPAPSGYLYLPALAIIALASVTMAPLGARVAHRTDVAGSSACSPCCCFGWPATCCTARVRP